MAMLANMAGLPSAAAQALADAGVLRPVAVGDPADLLDLADRRPLVAAEPGEGPELLDPRPAVPDGGLPGRHVQDPAEDDGAVAEGDGAVQGALDRYRRLPDPGHADHLAGLERHPGVLGLVLLRREVGARGVHLLEQ